MNIFPKNLHKDLFYTSISIEIFKIANNINKYHNKKIKNQIKESYKLFQENINLLVNKGENFPAPRGSNLIKEFCDNEKKLVIIWQ